MTDPDGGQFSYTYDGAQRLTLLVNPQGDRTSFAYDTADRRTAQTQANGVVTSYTYDNADRIVGLTSVSTTLSAITSFTYRYDNAANRLGVTEVDGTLTTWSYDATYQLTAEQRSGATSPDWTTFTLSQWESFTLAQWQALTLASGGSGYNTTYTYDPVGNRLVKNDSGQLTTSTFDAANQLVTSTGPSGVTTYTFDAAGNQQIEQGPAGITTSTWDNENRRTLAHLPNGIANTFSYNADGQRFQKQDSSGTTRFVWDGQAYLAETDGTNATQAEFICEPTTYGSVISQRRLSSGIWMPSYHVFDALGSTRALAGISSGVTDTYLYKAFGELLASTGSTVNPFQFVGQWGYYHDNDTGTIHVRLRDYHALPGRWTSQDPADSDFILYRYVWNRPALLIDPSGTFGIAAGAAGLWGLVQIGEAIAVAVTAVATSPVTGLVLLGVVVAVGVAYLVYELSKPTCAAAAAGGAGSAGDAAAAAAAALTGWIAAHAGNSCNCCYFDNAGALTNMSGGPEWRDCTVLPTVQCYSMLGFACAPPDAKNYDRAEALDPNNDQPPPPWDFGDPINPAS